MDNLDDFAEDLEELDEVEEVDELPSTIEEIPIDSHLHTCWIDRYHSIPIPSIIIDKSLNILWTNKSFDAYFKDLDTSDPYHLTGFFHNLKDVETMKKLHSALNTDENGYTWQGRVNSHNKRRRSDVANLLLTPLEFDDDQVPQTFTGVLDIITDEYREMLRNMFSSLLEASKLKDNDTGNHIERVNRYSQFIAETLNKTENYPEINEDYIDDIGFLAAMHDVGKIGTPDDILNKAGPLEKWEREVMNEHTKNGAYILSTYPNPMAKQIALHHHEKWDGTGYPFGMANQMIPLCARIVALADVYDALRMKRSYKEAFSHKKTKEIITSLSGTHFDPSIVNCFLENHNEFDKIYTTLTD